MRQESNERLMYVDPVKDLGSLLLNVEKPGRYSGGEKGSLAKNKKRGDDILSSIIAFPDLYEIGMGNHALRIIYNYMNSLEGVYCDRAFAPAPDFEKLLRDKNLPLYGLDTGISLAKVDLLMFTLGYELGLNGILTMLDVSGIPLRVKERAALRAAESDAERTAKYPIIIAGGPAVSNPLPYSPFIDAFWIGEAEAGFFDLVKELMKEQGREALLKKIVSHPNIWAPGKEKTKRAIYKGFSQAATQSTELLEIAAVPSAAVRPTFVYPVPSLKIIQNHGTVEIMRGCPNGCRFCHAGFWYRPARQKSIDEIHKQVNELITKGGWQQISLSSLSSGDYTGIDELIESLNREFSDLHVSFQLPSLKVSSFALSLLEKISKTRKSGLTFAVETPKDAWQMSINKEVSRESVISILEEAKKRGWKTAKFYFMIGLPVCEISNEGICEEEEIVSFITDIARKTKMHFNINVSIFIPKPHTPYQWSKQLDVVSAINKLNFIRAKLKPMGHKVSISDTLISQIEGLLSRGDERAGLICEEAWKKGSRLEPWDEYINKEVWFELLEKNSNLINGIFSGCINPIPWQVIDSNVTNKFLLNELDKSKKAELTPSCKKECTLCGVNNQQCRPAKLSISNTEGSSSSAASPASPASSADKNKNSADPPIYRILFSFTKENSAVFHGHLSLIEIFSMALRRAGIPIMYTLGFNPLAKLEFASPLSTGISARNEMAIADFLVFFDANDFKNKLNESLPEGIIINRAENFCIKSGDKKHSLSSLIWGFSYAVKDNLDFVNFKDDKVYKNNRLESDCSSVFDLTRNEVLARNIIGSESDWASYFDVYRYLYECNTNYTN